MNLKDAKKGAVVKTKGAFALGPDDDIRKGMRGRVVCITDQENVGVDFGKKFSGHTLDGHLSTNTGYWFYASELTLVTKAKPAKKRARR